MTLTTDQFDTLIEKIGGPAQAARILSGEAEVQLLSTADPLTRERFVTVAAEPGFDARVASGGYGWRNPALTEALFPVTPDQHGAREQKLFHFARSISSQDIIALIREAGFEPAQIGDILTFGEAFPDEQRRYPVVGLGSAVDVEEKLSIPVLWFDGDRRTLDLIWYDGDWHRNYRFLGVRIA